MTRSNQIPLSLKQVNLVLIVFDIQPIKSNTHMLIDDIFAVRLIQTSWEAQVVEAL
jgi:hypothetical protein